MNDIKLLHEILIKITSEIDRICRKNNIKYTLFAGSLLGAVRHHGFIPWDDDMDIAMLRADYDRFIEKCKTELGKEFRLVSIDNNPDYSYGFLKITMKGTKVKETLVNKPRAYDEIWVDVFPYDNVPSKPLKQFKQRSLNYMCIKLLEEKYDGIIKENKTRFLKKIFFGVLHMLNWFVPDTYIKKFMESNSKKYNNYKTSLVSCFHTSYGYKKETIKRKVFDNYANYKFDNKMFMGIKNYDYYLAKIYGNYMKLPPVEKRHTHNLKVLDYGKNTII